MSTLFPKILVILLFTSLIITLVDQFFWRRDREATGFKIPFMVDYARSFFLVFLIVVIIRSFIFQPYKVPTGSLEPTVQPVEYLMVCDYLFGVPKFYP